MTTAKNARERTIERQLLLGRTAVVTGASQGIGRSIALAFAREGARVAICARSAEALRDVVEEIRSAGGQSLDYCADVTDAKQVHDFFQRTRAAYGPIDVLVNNAGVSARTAVIDPTSQGWQLNIDTNLTAIFTCCRLAAADLIARKGCVINIASLSGRTGSGNVGYSAAKAGCIGLTRALARELGPLGVRVNAIAPGAIDTALIADWDANKQARVVAATALGRLGTPDEVARTAVFLASYESSFITGATIDVNGGQFMG